VQQRFYALLTNEACDGYGGPNRVLLASTLLASVLGLVLTGLAVAVLPWAMGMLYGNAFRGAEPAAAVAISTGLVHMAGAPAASRLTIVSLKLIGTINGLWAVAVIALGPVFIPRGGAVPATAIMLGMHVVNAVLVLGCLRKKRTLPAGLTAMSMPMVAGSVLFALLGWIRFGQPAMRVELSVASVLLALVLVAMVLRIGYTAGCVPPPARWRGLAEDVLKSGKARSAAC
jgi:O-antigen/teichoic acid export membrane protein